ncbi:hypothetical protein [Amorphus orientalis]|uniref:Uncharacterized protein n=1 Tax=Amorphus orientalis TaxID=649198 RepID=A0AAE4AV13_9HYPH|nr:hypothetical protein [Amorphus orientalis]MDQ0317757.1 hypothetical protein [Amorphus orientalis]
MIEQEPSAYLWSDGMLTRHDVPTAHATKGKPEPLYRAVSTAVMWAEPSPEDLAKLEEVMREDSKGLYLEPASSMPTEPDAYARIKERLGAQRDECEKECEDCRMKGLTDIAHSFSQKSETYRDALRIVDEEFKADRTANRECDTPIKNNPVEWVRLLEEELRAGGADTYNGFAERIYNTELIKARCDLARAWTKKWEWTPTLHGFRGPFGYRISENEGVFWLSQRNPAKPMGTEVISTHDSFELAEEWAKRHHAARKGGNHA